MLNLLKNIEKKHSADRTKMGRERLIELLVEIGVKNKDKVADHLLSNEVVVLPCKIGDMVWAVRSFRGGPKVKAGIVHQMWFTGDMKLIVDVKNTVRGIWGVDVFATKQEAYRRLADELDKDI